MSTNIISKKSSSTTKQLSNLCNDPVEAYMRMMSYLKVSEKYIRSIVNRNMFRKMVKLGLGTEEVTHLANRVVGRILNKRTGEIRRIMFRLCRCRCR